MLNSNNVSSNIIFSQNSASRCFTTYANFWVRLTFMPPNLIWGGGQSVHDNLRNPIT